MRTPTLVLLFLIPMVAVGLSRIPPKSNLVYCLDLMDGSVKWQIKNEKFAAPKITSDGKILKIEEWGQDGEQLKRRWSVESGAELEKDIDFSPTIELVDHSNGQKRKSELWEVVTHGSAICYEGAIKVKNKHSPSVVRIPEVNAYGIHFSSNIAVYVSIPKKGHSSVVKAYDLEQQKPIWDYSIQPKGKKGESRALVSLSTMSDGLLVDDGSQCSFIEVSSGVLKWCTDYGNKDPREAGGHSWSVETDNGYVIFGPNWIVALQRNNGAINWKRSVRYGLGSEGATVFSHRAIIALEFMTDKVPVKKWTGSDK